MKLFVHLFIGFSMVLSSCDSCKNDCGTGELGFDLPLKAYGIKDTLSLGDTIRIRLDIPDQLPERSSGYLYDFIDYNFKLITYMARIDTLPVGTDSKETFDWITLVGESKYSGGLFIVSPNYHKNTYQYELQIIAKKKGLFAFGMNSSNSNRFPLAKLSGPCSKLTVGVYPKLENETNVNFEFLQNSPDPIQQRIDRKRFDEFAGFCFYVR